MPNVDFSKREILKYVGDFTQVFGSKEYTLNSGKAQGVKAVDVKNGSGLEFTVLPDRCMDIAWLSYKGSNLSYISKTGVVAPQYYNDMGINWLRSFFAGFLTTCGLRNVGTPCTDDGEALGLHGRISSTPAENVSSSTEWENGKPIIKVKGKMREARLFGENIVLEREIICKVGENKLTIEDKIENYGFRKEPLMLLYHFNLGYPLLDENAVLIAPINKTQPRDAEAENGTAFFNIFQKPTPEYNEQVFFHDLKTDHVGKTCVALINEKLGLGVAIRFNKNQLFNLAEWKMMGEGEYVLGIEPCNCYGGGREDLRAKGLLEHMKPGEVRTFNLEIEVLDGDKQFRAVKNEISNL